MYKIRLQRDFLKLDANDRSNKRFLLTSKFTQVSDTGPMVLWFMSVCEDFDAGLFVKNVEKSR